MIEKPISAEVAFAATDPLFNNMTVHWPMHGLVGIAVSSGPMAAKPSGFLLDRADRRELIRVLTEMEAKDAAADEGSDSDLLALEWPNEPDAEAKE